MRSLTRAREQVETLAAAALVLEETLPGRVGDAVRDEAQPMARNLAEIRGLMNGVIRKLERIDGDLLADRNARVDDLSLLVDLDLVRLEGRRRTDRAHGSAPRQARAGPAGGPRCRRVPDGRPPARRGNVLARVSSA